MVFDEPSWDRSYDTLLNKCAFHDKDVDHYANYTEEWIGLLKEIFDAGNVYWGDLESLVREAGVGGKAGYGIDDFEKLRAKRQNYIENPNFFNELDVGIKGMVVRAAGNTAARFVHLHISRE
jgi:hypothetical protein